ncbi:MAG: transglycosylase SLT domain-containing protein [Acidobacteria bacterium]|nr:transglycosylase SLT domain-containing protein [Acidobacteriota bacterium]
MIEAILTYSTDEETGEIPLGEGKVSFGRGSEADRRFADDGLSRLHATVHREGDNIWILDENSTNGSFVNGEPVRPNGTILYDGDRIKIGNHTTLTVRIGGKKAAAADKPATVAVSGASETPGFPLLIPVALAGFAVLVIGISIAFIGYRAFGGGGPEIADETPYETETPDDSNNRSENRNASKTPKPSPSASESTNGNANTETISNTTVETNNNGQTVTLPKGRYQDMSEDDKNRYVAVKAEKIARIIGNQTSDPIPPEAVQEIKRFLGGYVSRLNKSKKDTCDQGSWVSSDFTSVLNRATRTSPFIVRSFRAKGIEPQIGLYVAMIESEHCACLTSSTGAKGMFQFLASSSGDYGLDPAQRCDPEQSARAGAQYLTSLITRFGTAPDSVPLAIASFNSGQGNLSKNLDTLFSGSGGQNRSFWTLAANKGMLQGKAGKQFNDENIKYVPKFFAAAIIGENPRDFGVDLEPLSTYTK